MNADAVRTSLDDDRLGHRQRLGHMVGDRRWSAWIEPSGEEEDRRPALHGIEEAFAEPRRRPHLAAGEVRVELANPEVLRQHVRHLRERSIEVFGVYELPSVVAGDRPIHAVGVVVTDLLIEARILGVEGLQSRYIACLCGSNEPVPSAWDVGLTPIVVASSVPLSWDVWGSSPQAARATQSVQSVRRSMGPRLPCRGGPCVRTRAEPRTDSRQTDVVARAIAGGGRARSPSEPLAEVLGGGKPQFGRDLADRRSRLAQTLSRSRFSNAVAFLAREGSGLGKASLKCARRACEDPCSRGEVALGPLCEGLSPGPSRAGRGAASARGHGPTHGRDRGAACPAPLAGGR